MNKKYFDRNDEEINVGDYIVWVMFGDVCRITKLSEENSSEYNIGAKALDDIDDICWFVSKEVRKISEQEAFHAKLMMTPDGLVQIRKPSL